MKRLCLECSAPIAHTQGSRCARCQAAIDQRISARNNAELGGSGGRWQAIRKQVYEQQEGRCARCGNPLPRYFEVDHIVPRAEFRKGTAQGQPSSTENLQALDRECHLEVTRLRRRMRRNGVAI